MGKRFLLKTVAYPFLLLIMLASVVSVSARIFSRRPSAGDVTTLFQQLGGQCSYRAPVRINGSPALLSVTGFDDPGNLRSAEIRAALQLDLPAKDVDSLHTIARDGKVIRLLLLHPDGANQTIAVAIEQTAAAFRQSRPGVSHEGGPLPVFPGATPGLQAKNEDTGLYFATMTAVSDMPRIAAFYHSTLAAAGWTAVFPAGKPHAGWLFLKENAFCMVLIIPSHETSAATRITLLHKPFKGL